MKPNFKKYPSINIWQVLLCSRDHFFIFYAWRSTSIHLMLHEPEILQKDKNCIHSVVQLHISKLCSSQFPEGFAVTHLLSSCTLFSKLCPGSKTSHLRPGFQSALKSTGISDMFWKLLYLIRARGNIIHAGLKSVGLAGLQIMLILFSLPRKDCI